MTGFTEKFQRNVVPRWHDSRSAEFTVETRSLKERPPIFMPDTAEIRQELIDTGTLGVAVDALNAAIVASDHEMAAMAAEIIHTRGAGLPNPIVTTARTVLGIGQSELPIHQPFIHVHQRRIRELRNLLSIYPRSPLIFLDLARHMVVVGQPEKARRAIAGALATGQGHRAILRAAARFYISIDEKERAYQLIRDAPGTRFDPWLIAAEIALGQVIGKSPAHWRAGKELLSRRPVAPIHLSELATASATMEMNSGNIKDAKRLFRLGILEPTENALAQVCWAEVRLGTHIAAPGSSPFDGNQAFEAEFFRAYFRGDLSSAMERGEQWFYSEPFSEVAISAAAHVAGLLDDYESVEKFATFGLHGHRKQPNLRNNLIYARISSGKVFEGSDTEVTSRISRIVTELRRYVDGNDSDGVHAMANLGLLAFRIGQPDDGRTIYERTIDIALKASLPQQAATAAVFFARESILARAPWANVAMERARTLAKPFASNSSAPGLPFYLKKVEALAKNPDQEKYILSGQSALEFSPIVKAVAPRLTVKRKADGGLIVWMPPKR